MTGHQRVSFYIFFSFSLLLALDGRFNGRWSRVEIHTHTHAPNTEEEYIGKRVRGLKCSYKYLLKRRTADYSVVIVVALGVLDDDDDDDDEPLPTTI